jgi:PAS domain S-box-containing protein
VARDTTERREAQRRFRRLLESAPDAMIIVGPEMRIILVNGHAERLFGHAREDLSRQPATLLIPPRFRHAAVDGLNAFFREPRMMHLGDDRQPSVHGLHKDGHELPLTTAQDYSLFFILGDYSTDLWRRQIEMIRARNGLVSVITHPDYLVGARERRVYTELLEYLASLREDQQTWVARPSEINKWWRARQQMTLTPVGESWRVDGPDSARALSARRCDCRAAL